MAKVGVVLSGCGVFDGAEIHESVLTLLALSKAGAEAVCMAPDIEQKDVINHLRHEPGAEKRNALVESARIARGKIKNIKDVKAAEIDAVIFPGGYGAVKNLASFAADGPACTVNPDVSRLVKEMHQMKKPIGAICIAPAVIAKILEKSSIELTIGNERETAAAIGKMGQRHVDCSVHEVCIDKVNRIVTTPAYMLAKNISEANEGIEKLVKAVLDMTKCNFK